MLHADEQHGGRSRRGGQTDEHAEASLEQREPEPRDHALARAPHEPLGLARFLPESLHHTQRPKRFVRHGQRRRLQLLHVTRLAPHAPAVDTRQDQQHRAHAERDQREGPVQARRGDDHRAQRDRRRHERNGAVDQDVLDRRCVVLDAVQRIGGATRIVILQRKPLHAIDHPGPDVQRQPLTDPGAQQCAPELLRLIGGRDEDQQAQRREQDRGGRAYSRCGKDGAQQRRQWSRADNVIDDDAERHGGEQSDRARQQPHRKQRDEMQAVWSRLVQNPPV
ncbi:MAG: hypothetical protein DMD40_02100 [Gemmatimonadetes bacterium]|nr:MAG: hypothetical protein DMD40_02100 [Gemmatimonadota bacterium]